MQRTYIVALTIALASVLGTSSAHAERYQSASRFGLGLELGAPSGLAGKYFLGHGQVAIQGGIGVLETWGDDGWQLHSEVVWHPAVLHRGPSVTIPLHLGVGGQLTDYREGARCFDGRVFYRCDDDTYLGVRAPIGISFLFQKTPMDLFLELALTIDVLHFNDDYMDADRDRAGLQGALGGRFYF